MLANRSIPACAVIPELAYPDLTQAIHWLTTAFGFTLRIRIGDHRAQLNVGDSGAVVLMQHPNAGAVTPLAHSLLIACPTPTPTTPTRWPTRPHHASATRLSLDLLPIHRRHRPSRLGRKRRPALIPFCKEERRSMPYRNNLILLTVGVVISLLLSRVNLHSGLTFTTPSRTVYVSYSLILSWLSLTACSLASSYILLLKLYRLFHPN